MMLPRGHASLDDYFWRDTVVASPARYYRALTFDVLTPYPVAREVEFDEGHASFITAKSHEFCLCCDTSQIARMTDSKLEMMLC